MTRTTPLCVAALAPAARALARCGPRPGRQRLCDERTPRAQLHHREQGGEVIAKGYSRPATISDIRVAHIPANLSFEDSDQKQRCVIRSVDVYPLGEAMAKAFQQATPNDEVAA